jgi:hypothetical protein
LGIMICGNIKKIPSNRENGGWIRWNGGSFRKRIQTEWQLKTIGKSKTSMHHGRFKEDSEEASLWQGINGSVS